MDTNDGKTIYDYIIYHKNCMDGFTGFYIFMKTKSWKPKPFVYPDVPSTKEIPPDIKDKNVIVIDVAYKPDILKQIAKLANKVLFIDHHITIRDDVQSLGLDSKLKIVYDEKESGASLVWKYFFSDVQMPKFIKLIKDNDIGNWKYPETLPFLSALEINYVCDPTYDNLKKWDTLLDDDYLDAMIERGKVYEEYKFHLIKKQAGQATIRKFPSSKVLEYIKDSNDLKVGMYKVGIISGGCPSTSLVGKYVAENVDCDFCLVYNYNMKKQLYIISLRSKDTDIGKIASLMGGGGHKLAAAFSVSAVEFHIDDLFVDD